jgi:hypothetical protein
MNNIARTIENPGHGTAKTLDPAMNSPIEIPASGRRGWRILFALTVLLAGAMFWAAPRLPMVDLPQHAAQVVALRDLLTHHSVWRATLEVNLFTPYLVAYALALPLTFIMPAAAAVKVVLMLAFFGLVAACVAVRKELDGDDRLDWLFIPGFFGFAFKWGFMTFLVATPFGLLFLLLAIRYAKRPSLRSGLLMFGAGIVLFFCHGLVFLFSVAIGGGFLVARGLRGGLVRLCATSVPFIALAAWSVIYDKLMNHAEPVARASRLANWGGWGAERLTHFVLYVCASGLRPDWMFVPMLAVMIAAPWLMGARFNLRSPMALVPLAAILAVWAFLPSEMFPTTFHTSAPGAGTFWQATFVYQRFALFLLPFYALAFRRPNSGGGSSAEPRRDAVVQALMACGCLIFIGVTAARFHRFGRESADFDTVLEAAEPGQRAIGLVFDTASPEAMNSLAYMHFPLWYQAEKGGWVDFNAAWFHTMVVRYKPDAFPPVEMGFEWNLANFDWNDPRYAGYRYFFVRRAAPLPASCFSNPASRKVLVRSAGDWKLYERAD